MTTEYREEEQLVKRRVEVRTLCDRCGQEIRALASSYDTREFELEFTAGRSYPDGGQKSGWRVPDLCDACVAMPQQLLRENGFKITPVEVDW